MRRASDRAALRNTIAGAVVAGVGVVLYVYGFSEWGTIALIFLGGVRVLFRGESVLGLARAWRRGNGGDDEIRKRRESGAQDGVEPT